MVFERVVSTPNSPMSHEVLYIGSAVPLETSEGLDAVQQPLRARYPVDSDDSIQGVLSTVNIIPEGIQLRFQGDSSHVILFPFSTLSLCAAVRCVKTTNAATGATTSRFMSLSSPEAGGANSSRPAIFTAITRRTKGRQVLECHGFVTNTPSDALDLVRWTSVMDRRSKEGVQQQPAVAGAGNYATVGGAGVVSSHRFDGDMSFRGSETSSVREFPIQMRAADPVVGQAAAPGFFSEPSPDGYFYSTKNTQVKRYSLHKFQGSTGAEDTPSLIGAGADQFVRRPVSALVPPHAAVAAATSVASQQQQQMHHHHHQQQQQQHHMAAQQHVGPALFAPAPLSARAPPMMVPVMGPPPRAFMRPVLVGPPPPPPPMYVIPPPRFFSPPHPHMMRARPVPVFVGPPGEFATLPRKQHRSRRGSRGSLSSSSGRSSSSGTLRVNGKTAAGKKNGRAGSSDGSSSRPRSPPTDYDGAPHGPRVSRREEFHMRERNGYGPIMYRAPPYTFYGPPPPGAFERARSQPPAGKKSKSKKDKSSKKNSKKSDRKSQRSHVYSENADNMAEFRPDLMTGSKANAENRAPRDFRRAENQFTHERAFSKSLAEETRKSTSGDPAMNAYHLNNAQAEPSADPFPMY